MTLPPDEDRDVRVIALYLPQFHPIPENDRWWGKGFTEWTNVAKAVPLFDGHYQPRVPADLGFYDLRLSEARQAQADLAREYGVDGFCYYHYWFNGRRLIERPFEEVLSSGRPDFPFCMCWANETWSRRWLGEERDILMEQTYSPEDDVAHSRWLAAAFADSRYIRVRGRPLFFIYRPTHLPDARRTCDTIRAEALRAGVPEPFLVGVDSHHRDLDYRTLGFDSTMNFTPNLGLLHGALYDQFSGRRLLRNVRKGVFSGELKVFDYDTAWRDMYATRPAFPHIPSVFVGWDNSARRGRRGVIVDDSSPERFGAAFRQILADARAGRTAEKVVVVNAWNEWAEGNYLEPDLKFGRGYLEALRDALQEPVGSTAKARVA